jgi:acetylornithine deacetylase/succinyl-diaminopimelate desuccinylase-like protein
MSAGRRLLLVLGALCATQAGAATERAREQAREILRAAIAYPTQVGAGQVPLLAQYLAGRFRAAGFPAADVQVLPLGETASLVVRYRGDGSGGRPIALLAHMDVVTAKREDWQRDPFTLVEENGYFYGRGTLDIKGEVALLTATFLRLKAEGFVPTRDLIIAFSGDEETAQSTALGLVGAHRALVDAEFALNGDGGGGVLDEQTGKPTLFYVQGAEKSYQSFEITTHNAGGHSSEPRLENAIYELADALVALRAYRFPVMWNDWTLGDFKAAGAVTAGPLGAAMTRFANDPHDSAAADEIGKDPAKVGRTRTTCVATLLRGGHADNALPQSATATANCRMFPGVTAEQVRAALQGAVGDKAVVQALAHYPAADASPMRADLMAAIGRAVASAMPGARVVPTMASYATDGAVFRAGGMPTYGVGSAAIKDSEAFAHGLNERLPVASFYAGLEYWDVLLHELAGRH